MTTLDELMAVGISDDAKPRNPRLTLIVMAVATVAITVAAAAAVARSGLVQLVSSRHNTHAAAVQQCAPPTATGTASCPSA